MALLALAARPAATANAAAASPPTTELSEMESVASTVPVEGTHGVGEGVRPPNRVELEESTMEALDGESGDGVVAAVEDATAMGVIRVVG